MTIAKIRKFQHVAEMYSKNINRRSRHVSMIFDDCKLVSIGTNEHRFHPIAASMGYRDHECHSELAAWLEIKGNRKINKDNLCLVNFRFLANGQLANSKPCKICNAWCLSVFSRIFYSSIDGMSRLF